MAALRRVTSIEPQSRPNTRRVNIFLDGRFAFSLGDELAVKLSVGVILSDPEVEELQRRDALSRVYSAALTLLSYRARGVSELQARLLRRGFDPSLVDEVVARLKEERILDDKEFAQLWVENRQAHSPRGNRLLQAELRSKGVDREIIDGVLPGAGKEEEAAYRVARRKARSLKGLEWQEFRRRTGDYLVRRGFGYELAASTTRRLWSEVNGSANGASVPDWDDQLGDQGNEGES